MITYQLAEELKGAGFPQKEASHLPHRDSDRAFCCLADCNLYAPTLSELIKACGEMTFLIGKEKTVALNAVNPMNSDKRAEGSTPEEAVARLWIALQK